MSNAECFQDYTTEITINDIGDLVVEFNGLGIVYDATWKQGKTYEVTVYGQDLTGAGDIVFKDGETVIKTVGVDCP